MKPSLLTFEQCMKIVNTHEESRCFYYNTFSIDNYTIYNFNYHLARFTDFIVPTADPSDNINALEMRGLTFVLDENGNVLSRYLLLTKFFNLNQTDISLYDVVKSKTIKNIYNKEDGSLISFIKLPNGKVLAKSKMSFESEQSDAAMSIYNTDTNIKALVDYCLDNDIVPIFEYVSFKNRIVLLYNNTELILLKLRNNATGEYLDNINEIAEQFGVKLVESFGNNYTLDGLIEMAETMTDIEGWVVEFTDGQMIKIKTIWYCNIHGLLTESISRENDIINMILSDTIDDMIAMFDPNMVEARNYIDSIIYKVSKHLIEIEDGIAKYIDLFYNECNGTPKDFALRYRKEKLFGIVMTHINRGDDIKSLAKKYILANTARLEQAREYLTTI